MTRSELLGAASQKLTEVALLLAVAGDDRLAADAEELAEWVEFSSLPSEDKAPDASTSH